MTNEQRMARIERLLRHLPKPRAEFYARRVQTVVRQVPVRVAGGETEWDLWLANQLDRIYTPVANEVKATGRTIVDATGEVLSAAPKALQPIAWPLAIALAAVGYLFFVRK